MSAADAGAMFVLGLAGSVHCVQMCGPVVIAMGGGAAAGRQAAYQQVLYHAGRISTYAAIGGAAAWAGGGIEWLGRLAGVAHAASAAAGVALLLAGAAMLAGRRSRGLIRIGAAPLLPRLAARLLRSAGAAGRLGTGLALGFLPCGLVYAAVVKSLAAPSPLSGAAEMAAFGLGTAGPLMGVGFCAPWIRNWARASNLRWAGACLVATGALLVWRGALPVPAAGAGCH
jgi:sulfite exporter TauE/SafE